MHIQKGAKDALVTLELISENMTYAETKAMAIKFYRYCNVNSPKDLKCCRNWNGYQFENRLCKFK